MPNNSAFQSSSQPISSTQAFNKSFSTNIVTFCRLLRLHGVAVGLNEEGDALHTLEKIPLHDYEIFYLALRTTLAKSLKEQQIFDEHFESFWQVWSPISLRQSSQKEDESRSNLSNQPVHKKRKQKFTTISDWLKKNEDYEEEQETAVYSPVEVLTQKDFSYFDETDLVEIQAWIQRIGRALANRQSRRYQQSRTKGNIDLRSCIRKNLRNGNEILVLYRKRKRLKKLRLVLLCDVSKSMDLYSRFILQFLIAFQKAFRQVDTFVFSTVLHYITPYLKAEQLNTVLDELAENIEEWSGGTRIGKCLQEYLSEYQDRTLTRNTIVLIMSDGWDTGELEVLEDAMVQLKSKSKYVIWLNPLKGYHNYQPTAGGMQTALPYIDYFGAAHNLQSMKDFAHSLANLK